MLEAISARAVWDALQGYSDADRTGWREQLATAVLSYRGSFARSRIYAISVRRLAELTEGQR